MFLNKANTNVTCAPEFEKFDFKDGAKDFEVLFLKDKPDYSMDTIKIKKKEDEERRKFEKAIKDAKDGVDDGKLDRSVGCLSDSDDASDDTNAKSTNTKKGDKKEEVKEESTGFFSGAKKFLGGWF